MAGEKVAPPKPEGQKKKEERDTKYATALKDLRQKRREENKSRRGDAQKRAQQYEDAYRKATRDEIEAKRSVLLVVFRPSTADRSTCLLSRVLPSSSESEVLTSSVPT